jgi:hypothetical protein
MTKGCHRLQDLIRGLDPDEGTRILVAAVQPSSDRLLQCLSGAMGAAPDPLLGQFREPALDQVQPGRVGGREVEVEARMPDQPAADGRSLVRGVVVQDEVDVELGRHLPIDALQELAELHCPVPAMELPDHFPAGNVEGGEQRGGAVTGVVVGAAFGRALVAAGAVATPINATRPKLLS